MHRLPILLALLLAATPAAASPERPLVLAFGDSLTAGYGLANGLGFAPQLQASLRRHGIAATVADGGVSGDTTAAARERLGWTLDGLGAAPELVIVELGGNDMLRNVDPKLTEANLDAILAELKRRKLKVLLAGMRAPRNVDYQYSRRFEGLFRTLAARHQIAFYPFFLDGAALVPGMMQEDGVHPTFPGVQQVVMRITPAVTAALAAR